MSAATFILPFPVTNRDGLIEQNMRLPEVLTSSFWSSIVSRPGHGLERDDVLQEANIGLIHAADTFDPTRGASFATHAMRCIRQSLCKLLRDLKRHDILSCDVTPFEDECTVSDLIAPPDSDKTDIQLAVDAALDELSPMDREILESYYIRFETHQTIATRLGCSTKTIQRRLPEAAAAFKRAYEK